MALAFAAAIGVAARVRIPLPFTPVPITLQTFAVLLAGAATVARIVTPGRAFGTESPA